MLSKRLINSNDAGGGVCTSDITDIFGDGSGVALYQLNWDASDMSGNYNGTATDVSFVNGYINEAGSFNGSSSFINIDTITFPSNDFTVSAWVNTNDVSAQYNMIITTAKNGSGSMYLTLEYDKLYYYDSISTVSLDSGVGTILNNTWYHCVITKSSSSGIKLYLNGSLVDSNPTTQSLKTSNTGQNRIGHYYTPTQIGHFNGEIDQFRIFNTALDSTQVTQLYNEAACEKTCTTNDNQLVSDCIAYYKMDGNANDALNTYDGTPTNVSWTQGRFGSAGRFNGSNAYFSGLPTLTNISQTFSISMWVQFDANPSAREYFFGGIKEQGALDSAIGGYVEPDGTLNIFLRDTTVGNHFLTSTDNYVSVWNNLILTVTGTTAFLYINGLEVDNITSLNSSITVDDPILGAIKSRGIIEEYFNGSIDQVRIYDRAITAAEVTTLYNEVQCPSTASFNTVLYTGNGSTQNVGGVGFQPDLVWSKSRSASGYWHVIADAVRGGGNTLASNETAAERTGGRITSFDNDGFTVNVTPDVSANANGVDYVAWCWKAGGDAVTNTDGSITSEVSANVDAGFSIVSYTGNGANNVSIGHGLDTAPSIIIVKRTSSSRNWGVIGSALGVDKVLSLNLTDAASTAVGFFPLASSSVISYGTQSSSFNENTEDYIAYCFAEKAGFSKFGSYTGNANGVTVDNLGFEPAFVMIKSSSNAEGWAMFDNKRGGGRALFANVSDAEYNFASLTITFTSDGFTVPIPSIADAILNEPNYEYIYMAFANQF
jgi:hypothetical protein